MMGQVDAVLLASGFSERFAGGNKLTQVFRGRSLTEHALALFCSHSGIARVHLIFADPAVGASGAGYAVNKIKNERPERGLCESVRLGVLASTADYYLFAHCDQPLLNAEVITTILSRRRPGRIVVPCRNGKPGNPALFAADFRRELLTLADGYTPRSIKESHPDRVINVPIEPEILLKDVDTAADLIFLDSLNNKGIQ